MTRVLGLFTLFAVAILAFAQQADPWLVPPSARKIKNRVALTGQKMEDVRKLYEEKCAACHGVKGDSHGAATATLGKEPADFAHDKAIVKHSDGELFFKITVGRAPMPAYERELAEKDRWQLVNYIRYLEALAQFRYLGARRTR